MAIEYHKKAIEIDEDYAPHYFNYANTLYDIGEPSKALDKYRQAYATDSSLKEQKEMIDKY